MPLAAPSRRALAWAAAILTAALAAALVLLPDPGAGTPDARDSTQILMIKAVSGLIVMVIALVVASIARFIARGSYRVYYATLSAVLLLALLGLGGLVIRREIELERGREDEAFNNETRRLLKGFQAEMFGMQDSGDCGAGSMRTALEGIMAHLDNAHPRRRNYNRAMLKFFAALATPAIDMCEACGVCHRTGFGFDAATTREEFDRVIETADHCRRAVIAVDGTIEAARSEYRTALEKLEDQELAETLRDTIDRLFSADEGLLEFARWIRHENQLALCDAIGFLTLARDRMGLWTYDELDSTVHFESDEDQARFNEFLTSCYAHGEAAAQAQQALAERALRSQHPASNRVRK